MLNLHLLEQEEHGATNTMFARMGAPRDWIEMEERRRTWWVIYVADRLVSATSGLPALIDDRQVSQ